MAKVKILYNHSDDPGAVHGQMGHHQSLKTNSWQSS